MYEFVYNTYNMYLFGIANSEIYPWGNFVCKSNCYFSLYFSVGVVYFCYFLYGLPQKQKKKKKKKNYPQIFNGICPKEI